MRGNQFQPRRQGPPGRQGFQGHSNPPVSIPDFRLLEGENIPEDLLGEKAFAIVEAIMRSDRRGEDSRNTKSQVRRFYGEVKNLERRLQLGEDWGRIKPLVKMVKAKIAYAKERRNGGLGSGFKAFIDKGIDQVGSKEEFSAFCLLFEAVLGYLYGEGGLKEND